MVVSIDDDGMAMVWVSLISVSVRLGLHFPFERSARVTVT